tara:strand:+ start:1506 stop:2165 length:660 start_codon:yes stop_codon:yes gene_type:complete
MDMKKILIILLFAGCANSLKAQNFDEWFWQKKTQKKYLIQQIAALQVYIDYAQKGYAIAKEGLDIIGNLKEGELGLHTDYFNSLENVNPEIRQYANVPDIMAIQAKIVQRCNQTRRHSQRSNLFNTEEKDYIGRVLDRLLVDCANVLDELLTVVTHGKLEMTDDERLERIDMLYQDMMRQYTFSQSFSNETLLLSISRKKESHENQTVRTLYGITGNVQ